MVLVEGVRERGWGVEWGGGGGIIDQISQKAQDKMYIIPCFVLLWPLEYFLLIFIIFSKNIKVSSGFGESTPTQNVLSFQSAFSLSPLY